MGATLAVAISFGCSVDESGLAGTSEKLQRDSGATGGFAIGSGGNIGRGGSIGDGGATITGGTTGSGGIAVGTGGVSAAGGAPGTGGVTGAAGAPGTGGTPGTGGVTSTGGTPGTGGVTSSGGTSGTGGMSSSGGTSGTGGVTSSGGTPGTGGVTSAGGAPGTGGATATGGISGTGGAPGTGGTPGTGGGGMKCGPGTCDGCCATNGQCVRNVTAKQCGGAGAACTACAPCEICSGSGSSASSCAIDPTSQWTIVAVSGQVSMTPPGGGTWDPPHGDEGGSAPDLFCEYENPSGDLSPTTAGVTDTVTDVFTANWDQTITPPGVTVSASALMASKPAWRIWVGDEDCSGPMECGTSGQIACSYQQPISAASLMSGNTTISNDQSCVALQLSFVCQAPRVAAP